MIPTSCHYSTKSLFCDSNEFSTNSVCSRHLTPSYLSLMCTPLSTDITRRHLYAVRSAARGDLIVPLTKTVRYGPRSFAVSGPSSWDNLPSSLKSTSLTPSLFCRELKTAMFHLAYARAHSS